MAARRLQQELAEVATIQHFRLGALLRMDGGSYRYARAGEKLTAGGRVYGSQIESPEPYPILDCTGREGWDSAKLRDRLWGAIRCADDSGIALGQALTDVPEGYYCWIEIDELADLGM